MRAIRYIVKSEAAAEALCRVGLPLLLVRSLDVVLDNKLERLQGVRLLRQLLSATPSSFPVAASRCLVSIAKDGIQERDILVRSCWAALAELTLLNPKASYEVGGISAILTSVMQGTHSAHISEALLSCILYMLNSPKLRVLLREDVDMQHFVSTFTDCYVPSISSSQHRSTDPSAESQEQRDARFTGARNALATLLRSWPGLIYLCRTPSCGDTSPNGMQTLIETLHMPYPDVRRHVMEIIFELLNLPVPTYCEDFQEALLSSNQSSMQDSWQLYDGFVASEGKALLPHISKCRQNLFDNYLAILLYSFVCYGITDALIAVITKPKETANSVCATILLGEILHLTSQLLPSDVAQKCHALPGLVNAATSADSTAEERNIACAAITCLNRMHACKKRTAIPCSLYLDQLLQFCAQSKPSKKVLSEAVGKNKVMQSVRKSTDDAIVIALIKDSLVTTQEQPLNWDWELISNVLSWPSDAFKKFEDVQHRNFVRRLVIFFKPSNKQFAQIEAAHERGKIISVVGCHLIDFLIEADESKSFEYLEDILQDISSSLSQITSQSAILSPTRLLSTLSHHYFLFIGRMSGSNKGKKLLEKSGLFQIFSDLVSVSSHDVYAKLILSSLDYTKEGSFARPLFTRILTSSSDSSRAYATNFLRVLLRAGLTDFRKWPLELLVQQIHDKNPAVSIAAIDILDEACDFSPNLEALIAMRPSFLHIGDSGTLLLVRYASSIAGLKYLKDSGQLADQLQLWKVLFNMKYVKLVENTLNEALTHHRRSEDGTYGRRTDRRVATRFAYIPVHFYGQLAAHDEGCKVLTEEPALKEMFEVLKLRRMDTELDLINLKAALWAVGHIGASALGYEIIEENELIATIVKLAADAPVLSIRGTCVYVLGLLASSEEGALAMKEFGWDAIMHIRGEKWPLTREIAVNGGDVFETLRRKEYSWSLSSAGTRLTDLYDLLTGKRKPLSTAHSIVGDEDNLSGELAYGSLPALDTDEIDTLSPPISERAPRKTLLRGTSLSPTHQPANNALRPRSCSDSNHAHNGCTSSTHNTIADEGGTETERPSTSGDVPKAVHISSVVRASSMSSTARRKISAPSQFPVSLTLPSMSGDVERTRSGSYGSSGIVSFSSSGSFTFRGNPAYPRSHSRLSPIASLSSITSSLGYTNSGPQNVYSTLPRIGQNTSIRSPTGNQAPVSFESIPTTMDSLGYATLRAIQRRRVQSLGFYHSTDTPNSDGSSDEDEISTGSINLSASLNLPSRQNKLSSSEIVEESSSMSSALEEASFMGLCLPVNLALLFTVPVSSWRMSLRPGKLLTNSNPSQNANDNEREEDDISEAPLTPVYKTHLDKISNDSLAINNGLELHTERNCLLCSKVVPLLVPEISLVDEGK